MAILAAENRALAALTHDQVDGSGRPRHEGNDRRLVALPQNPQCPMSSLHPEVFDVGGASLANTQSVESQQDGKRSVVPAEAL